MRKIKPIVLVSGMILLLSGCGSSNTTTENNTTVEPNSTISSNTEVNTTESNITSNTESAVWETREMTEPTLPELKQVESEVKLGDVTQKLVYNDINSITKFTSFEDMKTFISNNEFIKTNIDDLYTSDSETLGYFKSYENDTVYSRPTISREYSVSASYNGSMNVLVRYEPNLYNNINYINISFNYQPLDKMSEVQQVAKDMLTQYVANKELVDYTIYSKDLDDPDSSNKKEIELSNGTTYEVYRKLNYSSDNSTFDVSLYIDINNDCKDIYGDYTHYDEVEFNERYSKLDYDYLYDDNIEPTMIEVIENKDIDTLVSVTKEDWKYFNDFITNYGSYGVKKIDKKDARFTPKDITVTVKEDKTSKEIIYDIFRPNDNDYESGDDADKIKTRWEISYKKDDLSNNSILYSFYKVAATYEAGENKLDSVEDYEKVVNVYKDIFKNDVIPQIQYLYPSADLSNFDYENITAKKIFDNGGTISFETPFTINLLGKEQQLSIRGTVSKEMFGDNVISGVIYIFGD